MKFTFKIPYGAMSEAPFQTNTHLSLKKKKKKRETQYRIKASNHLFTEQKNRKKIKKRSKNPSDNTRLSIKKKKKTERNAVLF